MSKFARFEGKVYRVSPPKERGNGDVVVTLDAPGGNPRTVMEKGVQYTEDVPDWAKVTPRTPPIEDPTPPRSPLPKKPTPKGGAKDGKKRQRQQR